MERKRPAKLTEGFLVDWIFFCNIRSNRSRLVLLGIQKRNQRMVVHVEQIEASRRMRHFTK